MNGRAYIAVDLGAESGRVIVGRLTDGRLEQHEVHRFRHTPVPTPQGLVWDFTSLWQQILLGLSSAAAHCVEQGVEPASVGVDTWGVDGTLVSEAGGLIGVPGCYREPALTTTFEAVCDEVGRDALYDATGTQLMPFNTAFQLVHRHRQDPRQLDAADRWLFMPDLFHWLLSGRLSVELTIASTSQLVDARTKTWNPALRERLGLPAHVVGDLVRPGTVLGGLTDAVVRSTGLPASCRVVTPPSHDTAAAIAAVPADASTSWCYLSSGTWSLLGAELDDACITAETGAANFTNELGVNGTVRFLKNIAGLWLVQEVRRQLDQQGQTLEYADMTRLAAEARAFQALVPVNDPVFAPPGGMIDRLQAYAKQTGQPEPTSVGALVRCCLESLALEYGQTLRAMEQLLGRSFDVLHLVGGGGRNALLNQMAADATGKRVVVGPEEGTAIGNLLTQAMGLGDVDGLRHLRRIVRDSTELSEFTPAGDGAAWHGPAECYAALPAAAS